MSENLDKQIEKEINEQVSITSQDKEDIWNHLEQELFGEETKAERKRGEKKMKNKKRWIPWVVTAAAVAFLWIGSQTETGYAIIDQIKTMFAPEKEITQSLEGMDEETKLNLEEGSASDYVIYIDESRYRMVKGEEIDIIIPKAPLEEKYPEVSMSIQEIPNQLPQSLINGYAEELQAKGFDVSDAEEVNSPVEGWMVRGRNGMDWDASITRYYVVENGKEGSFVFTQKFFLEAAEGHGVRLDEMLKEFYIVEE